MKVRFASACLAIPLLLLLVASCGRAEERLPGSAFARPTVLATPTLIPGLPTSTPWSAEEPEEINGHEMAVNPTPPTTPTLQATATATPEPAERLELGRRFLENENYSAAAEQMQSGLLSEDLTGVQRQEALMVLGQAQLAAGQEEAASETFGALLADAAGKSSSSGDEIATTSDDSSGTANAYYFLAHSYAEQGDCGSAIRAYEAFLEVNVDMAAYIQPLIADCHLTLGEPQQAIAAYEAAVSADAHKDVMVGLRYRLAQLYAESGDYQAAVEQYDAVLNMVQKSETRGQATYLAGTAEIAAGNLEAGNARYREAVAAYPEAYESYLALMALIEAGHEVDDYQRGLVDYYAGAYEPAVAALGRYLELEEDHEEDAHLYLAWSLEGLGNVPTALDQLQAYIDAHILDETVPGYPVSPETSEFADTQALEAAARGLIERAKLLARAGMLTEAAAAYSEYVETYPEFDQGSYAAWWRAAITEQLGDRETAIAQYQALADLYPEHEDADEALYRAGLLSSELGDPERAQAIWEATVELYPNDDYGAAALIELMGIVADNEKQTWLDQASDIRGSGYFHVRARNVASGTVPFEAPSDLQLELSRGEQRAAEVWLKEFLELPANADISSLSSALAGDGRLNRGKKLWQLGLRQEAKRELEDLRSEKASDALESYRLALFFRELGLYRSSILAAASLMADLNLEVLDAPRFIAGLAYPTYYSDLIMAEAQNYGYDPLLQFALVRQESMFESFATSGAAAQGLSQVIPDTGAYIAQRLGWNDFVNEDLYRPYVGIAFGAYYLDQQLEAFDGNVAAALSAYNAGPGNAARWYEAAGGDIDEYLATVDFSETRQYIERIYAGQAIYRHLYGTD